MQWYALWINLIRVEFLFIFQEWAFICIWMQNDSDSISAYYVSKTDTDDDKNLTDNVILCDNNL